jgi:hypothetical protein
LKEKVQLNEYVQISCLPPTKSNSYPGLNIPAFIVGWGSTSDTESTYLNQGFRFNKSDELQNAKITVYNSSACVGVYPDSEKNWNAQICAGELAGGIDICYGDEGNSLYVEDIINGREKYVTAGVVSYGVIFNFLIK